LSGIVTGGSDALFAFWAGRSIVRRDAAETTGLYTLVGFAAFAARCTAVCGEFGHFTLGAETSADLVGRRALRGRVALTAWRSTIDGEARELTGHAEAFTHRVISGALGHAAVTAGSLTAFGQFGEFIRGAIPIADRVVRRTLDGIFGATAARHFAAIGQFGRRPCRTESGTDCGCRRAERGVVTFTEGDAAAVWQVWACVSTADPVTHRLVGRASGIFGAFATRLSTSFG